jgi:hypothetical protein
MGIEYHKNQKIASTHGYHMLRIPTKLTIKPVQGSISASKTLEESAYELPSPPSDARKSLRRGVPEIVLPSDMLPCLGRIFNII